MLARLPVVIVALFALCSAAAAQTSPSMRDINRINGFDEMIRGIPKGIEGALDQIPGNKPEQFIDAWSVALEEAFDPKQMIEDVEALVAEQLTSADLAALFKHFDSPFGRKVSAIEIAAEDTDNDEKVTKGSAIYSTLSEKDPERLTLYNRLLDGLEAIDMAEAVALNMTYSMVAGMAAAAKQPASDQQISAMVKQGTANMRESITGFVNASTAFVYAGLELDELRRYVEFIETPEATRYYRAMQTALDRVISKEARSFGNSLMVAMGQRKA